MESDATPGPRSTTVFTEAHASNYDTRFAKLEPLQKCLHLLAAAVLADLPADAHLLCVGAGVGAEIVALAQQFPGWSFTAVEPSRPMLDVCRRRTAELGLDVRCDFHEGFLDSMGTERRYDAATSFLVSQFILDASERIAFYRSIADRLQPRGRLLTADLACDVDSPASQSLRDAWYRLMQYADLSAEQVAEMREAHRRQLAIVSPAEVRRMMELGGFEEPVSFLQTGLIHAWYAQRT
ncbi:MAG: class I SAM-dependent methyltransferase [Pirellulales bacterium]|nr:class I SAM-dependent methyltransferase [Pirellulales bacterium]